MILTDQLGRTPNHPLLLERLNEIEQAIQKNAKSGTRDRTELELEDVAPDDDSVFDIAASLDALDELEEATRSSRPPSSIKPAEEVDVDQVFAKFKEGVRAQVAESDSSTHYDLGVAYKEMGLLPDAISEFEIAAREPKIECMCCAMVGMIFLEQGDLEKAAEAYVRGLSASQKTIDQEMSLYYDLGTVYEMKGSASEALYYFKKIARRDPGYRDVRERIEALDPARAPESSTSARSLEADDEFDAAFDELFESK
jgi:tetratricopeptide (TPR) repeat protein